METPPTDTGSPSGPALPSDPRLPPADPAEREAVRFLREGLLPALKGPGAPRLARAVRSALDRGALDGLGRLPERDRRDLLEAIEEAPAAARRAASPRAMVRLTSVIAQAPEATQAERRVASPAR